MANLMEKVLSDGGIVKVIELLEKPCAYIMNEYQKLM